MPVWDGLAVDDEELPLLEGDVEDEREEDEVVVLVPFRRIALRFKNYAC